MQQNASGPNAPNTPNTPKSSDAASTRDPADERRPRAVFGVGAEPDPRFSMANERTALAWVRTALAVVAAGVGLTSVARIAELPRVLDVVAAVLCVAGGWIAVSAVLGWRRREVALRTARPLPAPVALPWIAAAVVLGSIALAVIVVAG